MDVLLKPELEKFIGEKLRSGQYANASDLVNEALQVLKDQEEFSPEHEAYLRTELRRGLEQLDAGLASDFDAGKIIAEERRRLSEAKRND
jgi:putative addiction module CopG family antidote